MTRARIRRMGNSLGVIIPKTEAERKGLHAGDEVELEVRKAMTLASARGILKGKLGKVDALNDLIDEGEDLG
ncbi:MAG: AbrB/MazE/SpoVT family DNA-binding domain-containing protein [Thermoplasmatota archaeon]